MKLLFANTTSHRRIVMFVISGVFAILADLTFNYFNQEGIQARIMWDFVNTAIVGLLIFETMYRTQKWLNLYSLPLYFVILAKTNMWLYPILFSIELGRKISTSTLNDDLHLTHSLFVIGLAYFLIIVYRNKSNNLPVDKTSKNTLLLEFTLWLIMVATIITGVWIRLSVAGWGLIFLGIPLLIAAILHYVFQVSAILKISRMKSSYIVWILLSNLFFFLGFALQFDCGDNNCSLAIAGFYYRYFKEDSLYILEDQPAALNVYMFISIAFLLSLIFSWFLLHGKRFLKRETSG